MRVGLVLGGGGVIGLAYHAAALAALENDLRWDPRKADVVVGTSAGSLVGALLRSGLPAMDLAALAVDAELFETPPQVAEVLRDRPELPPVENFSLRRLPRLPPRGVVTSWLRRPWRFDPVTALASILPDGSIAVPTQMTSLGAELGDAWPADDLWICVARQRDLKRRLFGLDLDGPLAAAVTASCAVPGYFPPVPIEGERYVDGGVRSPTNADVLARAPIDFAIIVSPMSGRDLGRIGSEAIMRRYLRRKLQGERAVLRAAGIESFVIEPGSEVIPVLGIDFMNGNNIEAITHAAFLDTGRQLSEPTAGRLRRALGEGADGSEQTVRQSNATSSS
jgi:NTE family protein